MTVDWQYEPLIERYSHGLSGYRKSEESETRRSLALSVVRQLSALPPPLNRTVWPTAVAEDRSAPPPSVGGHRGSTLPPDFHPFSESASSTGAGFKAMIEKALWWHVCNSIVQT